VATEKRWEKTKPAPVPTTAATQPVLRTEPVVQRSPAVRRQERLKQQVRSAQRPAPEVRAWRLARLALVFAARVAQPLIPWRVQLGYVPRLCSCRSNRRWLKPWRLHRAWFSKFPRVSSPASPHNRFHAARVQSRPARSLRKARKGARFRATWTTARANTQPGEEIPAQPFQFVNFRDSIKRGSRIGKSEVLGTTCK
jgi:hypothetical protein